MAILVFPPTTGEPDDGSFTYTLNGVLYAWDGQKWTANTESELDSRYVERTGDNMIGDLTLGGDKITLDAGDGSATFKGDFNQADWSTGLGVRIKEGYIFTRKDTDIGADRSVLAAFNGGSENNDIVAQIRYDGSASFAGAVSIGGKDAAHTIDEYEEGTATLTSSLGTCTCPATYTKIGDIVYLTARAASFSDVTTNDTVSLGNLPFVVKDSVSGGSIFARYINTPDANSVWSATYPNLNLNRIIFYSTSSGNWAAMKHKNLIDESSAIYFQAIYRTE